MHIAINILNVFSSLDAASWLDVIWMQTQINEKKIQENKVLVQYSENIYMTVLGALDWF